MEKFLFILTIIPIVGSLIQVFLKDKSDKIKFNFANLILFIEMMISLFLVTYVIQNHELAYRLNDFCGLGLSFKFDGFRAVYCCIAVFMWLMTTLFSKEYFHHYTNKTRYLIFNLLTCAGTIGVFLSADLFTTFIYFEMMSIASYIMVIHDQTSEALDAGLTYLVVAVLGGMVLLMGLFILYTQTNTLVIDELYSAIVEADSFMIYVSGGCMLFGFGAKAGLFPLHIWLPKAHPVAPAPASALLSGILTKTGVFGMIVISMEIFRENMIWALLILFLGIVTMLLGAVLAVFSTNLKRTLACSSMSQIGFISVGLAMSIFLNEHNALAVRGTILHMVNHSLIKLLLFMIAGVIYMNLHELDLNKIRGFGRKKGLLHVLYLVGALGISGIPFFNGYVSKTLIHESIVEFIALTNYSEFFTLVEWLFIIAGGLTLAYMTKLYVCIFIEKNQNEEIQKQYDEKKNYMNSLSTIVLVLCAVCLVLLGMIPNITSDAIANLTQDFMHAHHLEHTIHYFSSINLIGAFKSIGIGILVYLFMIRPLLIKKNVYLQVWPKVLDLEVILYRPMIQYILPFIGAFICRVIASIPEFIMWVFNRTLLKKKKIKKPDQMDYLPQDLQQFSKTSILVSQIESSLSFGLLIAGLGIVFGMIYILLS